MGKYKILGIMTDAIKRDGNNVLGKNGEKLFGAIGWYRVENPLKKLGAVTEIGLGVSTTAENALKLKEMGDIWYCKMADNEGIDLIYGAHKEFTGCKFVLDLDDDIDNIDPEHPDYEELKKKLDMRIRMVKMADHVVVATEEIKRSIKHLNPYITVIPNSIDPEIWKVKRKKRRKDYHLSQDLDGNAGLMSHNGIDFVKDGDIEKEFERNDGKIRIGWMSSGSHFADSPIIEDTMAELQEEYPNVEFHIAGMVNNDAKGKCWIHHKGTTGYLPFPQFYADLDIDIAIAPIKDTQFNRCKSNIKFLEASMLGIPTVASDVTPYRCIQHGKTGYLASTPGQFKKYLKWLIDDEKKRKEIGKEAKKYVLENWTIDKFLPKYEELFDKLMDKKDITVITAITGDKDTLKRQPEYPGVKYLAFSDNDIKDEQWEVRKACDKFTDPVMNAKIHKVLSHKYCDTPYIFWIDGRITLKKDPHELIELIGDKDFAFFKHPGWDSVYEEANACVRLEKGKILEIGEQIKDYSKKNVPDSMRHCELTAFFRKNKNNEVFERWWAEICRYSSRDQISFPVIFKDEDWETIPGTVDKDSAGKYEGFPGNEYFKTDKHNK